MYIEKNALQMIENASKAHQQLERYASGFCKAVKEVERQVANTYKTFEEIQGMVDQVVSALMQISGRNLPTTTTVTPPPEISLPDEPVDWFEEFERIRREEVKDRLIESLENENASQKMRIQELETEMENREQWLQLQKVVRYGEGRNRE